MIYLQLSFLPAMNNIIQGCEGWGFKLPNSPSPPPYIRYCLWICNALVVANLKKKDLMVPIYLWRHSVVLKCRQ